MNAQQLLNHIIKPTLGYMGGNYDSKNAQMLLLATAAIESKCGHYIKQVNGPALGIWQMEPATHDDIILNCDALKSSAYQDRIDDLIVNLKNGTDYELISPAYACAMARLKYSMDSELLPKFNDREAIYKYYKRIYNTELGASTWLKFAAAWDNCGLSAVDL